MQADLPQPFVQPVPVHLLPEPGGQQLQQLSSSGASVPVLHQWHNRYAPGGRLLLIAQPFVIGLAFALGILHDGVTVLNADRIIEAAQSLGAAPEIAELALLIESGGIPNHMIVNMACSICVTD